ncbi:hypothetical protein REPUB_Repub12eG0142100 [Reevesia pubescens]
MDGDGFQNKNFFKLENEEHVPCCAFLSFTIKDPRVLPATRTSDFPEPDSVLEMLEVEANDRVNLTGNLNKNEKVGSPSCSKTEGNGILSYNKNLWDISSRIDFPEEENELCMEKHQQRMGFFCLDDPNSGPPKTSNKIGLPYFPSDFPDCNAYLSLKEIEATASRQNAERRPLTIRPFRIPIPPLWIVVHAAFDKLSMNVKEAEISSDKIWTSNALTDCLNGIHGENFLIFPQFQNSKLSLVKVMKDKSKMGKGQNGITQSSYSHKLCFVRVHLHAYKEGVFEDGAVVCAPFVTNISVWTSSYGTTKKRLCKDHPGVCSYPFFRVQVQDPASIEQHWWPVGFVTTGFVRGSKKPKAEAFCEAVLLACLREDQWKEMPVNHRRKEIYVLVRKSSAYRLALATIVLEQQEEDVEFM